MMVGRHRPPTFDELREVPKEEVGSTRLKYRTDCYEFLSEWIGQQAFILGMQYQFYEKNILEQLVDQKIPCTIIIDPLNDFLLKGKGEAREAYMENILYYYPLLTPLIGWDEIEESIWVFSHDKGSTPSMHLKQMYGAKETSDSCFDINSLVIGSFNVTHGAKRNIESLVSIDCPPPMMKGCLLRDFFWLHCRSIPWSEYVKKINI